MAQKNSAFMKPVQISEPLARIVGAGPMPRTQVVKKIWEYIKKHNLQDKKDKKMINPDQQLAAVLGKAQISMFAMTKQLSNHLKSA